MTRPLLNIPDHKNKTAQDCSGAVRNSTLQAILVPQFSAFFNAEVAIHACSGDGDAQRYVLTE
jgi:hypothetical protein